MTTEGEYGPFGVIDRYFVHGWKGKNPEDKEGCGGLWVYVGDADISYCLIQEWECLRCGTRKDDSDYDYFMEPEDFIRVFKKQPQVFEDLMTEGQISESES